MRIRLGMDGPANEEGARFRFEAVLEVEDAEEAEFSGRKFGTLTHHLQVGIVEAQRIALGMPPE